MEEEHKGLLCPKLDGGYPSPKEMSSASSNLPSYKGNLKSGNLDPTDTILGIQMSWAIRAWSRPMSAWGGWPVGGRCFAEQKWLKPDITLFAFPVKIRDHFTFLFYLFFRDQSDIFNSTSFLLSTGVSCGVALRKGRAMT